MSEGSLPADNPFVDPSLHETPSALQGEATLFVTEDASLTIGADAIIIFGMSHALLALEYPHSQFVDDRFVHREAANCCGLLPTSAFALPTCSTCLPNTNSRIQDDPFHSLLQHPRRFTGRPGIDYSTCSANLQELVSPIHHLLHPYR